MATKSTRKKQAAKKTVPKPATKPATKAKGPQLVEFQAVAAKLLGVDRRTLIEWAQKPGFPKVAKGWDVEAIRVWADGMGLGGSAKKPDSDKSKLYAIRLRHEAAAMQREELKLQQELGGLLDRDDVERMVQRVVATTKAVLEQLPDRLEQNLHGLVDAETRTRHRNATLAVIHDCYAVIEQMLSKDEDEEEEEKKGEKSS